MANLSNMEISSFCSQMALILKSGISSMEGISMMLEESESSAEKVILQHIHETLLETGSFYRALETADVFPNYMLHMTDIGEQSGRLDDVMDSLARYYEREESMARAIKSAVTYPMLMISMMIVVIIILLTRVLPVFNQIFSQFGQEMTGFSKTLLHIGSGINRYAVVLVVLICLALGLFLFFHKTVRGKDAFMKFSYHFRALKTLYERTASCRFAGGMALTLSSGLNFEYSMELVGNLIENELFSKKLAHCRELMQSGTEFSTALTEAGIFSGVYGRMVSIASRTGNMDMVMKEIAEKYEDELDTRLTNMIALLEPTLVIILSVIVGFILLSVMLPLIGIMSGL